MATSLQAASIASLSTTSILYGIFLALCTMYMFLTVGGHGVPSQPKATYKSMPFIGSVLLFCAVTPHWIIVVWRSLEGFVYYEDGTVPLLYFTDMTAPSCLSSDAFAAATLLVGDCLLIYRLWVIWDRNMYIVILPTLSVLGGIAAFTGLIYTESHFHIGDIAAMPSMNKWLMSCYGSTVGTNVYSCGFIYWRLWRRFSVPALNPRGRRAVVMRTLIIITESAALYVSWALICLLVTITDSAALNIVGAAVIPVTGITFMLINVRVKLGYAVSSERAPAAQSIGLTRYCKLR